MAEGQDSSDAEAVERGDIFFFYRPKVDVEAPGSLDDVQRFHVVMRKAGGHLFRFLTIGRKRLPDIQAHEREWGFVDFVSDKPETVAEALREQTYETKTRGTRTQPAGRPAGEGAYALAQGGRNLYLVYELDLPEAPGPVQDELNIAPKASYILSVKNPKASNPPNVGLREGEEAHYPKALQKEFAGRRFAGEDPHLLDFEGAEFILIGAGEEPEQQLGVEVAPVPRSTDATAVLRRLKIPKREVALEPLIRGEWA